MARKNKEPSSREKRRLRTQQLIFMGIALMIILVMVVSTFARF